MNLFAGKDDYGEGWAMDVVVDTVIPHLYQTDIHSKEVVRPRFFEEGKASFSRQRSWSTMGIKDIEAVDIKDLVNKSRSTDSRFHVWKPGSHTTTHSSWIVIECVGDPEAVGREEGLSAWEFEIVEAGKAGVCITTTEACTE